MLICGSLFSIVQAQKVTYQSTKHYRERVDKFAQMRPIDSLDVVMLGNSLTEMAGDWNVLLRAKRVRNRGISGDDAMGMINRLQQITPGKPKAIFLMVGINDLSHDLTPTQVYDSLCESDYQNNQRYHHKQSFMCRVFCPFMRHLGVGKHSKVKPMTFLVSMSC